MLECLPQLERVSAPDRSQFLTRGPDNVPVRKNCLAQADYAKKCQNRSKSNVWLLTDVFSAVFYGYHHQMCTGSVCELVDLVEEEREIE